MIGVALGDIAIGETGELAIEEVWDLPKEAALVVAQGDTVYWDAVNLNIDKTNTNTPAGKAFSAAIAAAATVRVKINA
jgi:predicted RecA/RadA family phage recombinase